MRIKELRAAPLMACHNLSDTPLHSAERIIHIFFDERAGAPRPAQIVRRAPSGEELICWKCGVNSRPWPDGATKETKYVCPACSPLGVVCGGQVDRCAFDNWAIPERGQTERDVQFSFRELVNYFINHSEDISSVPSARILFYRQNGLAWAREATSGGLRVLGARERAAFVAFYWAGLSGKEIASAMEISNNTVHSLITQAKIKLGHHHHKPT